MLMLYSLIFHEQIKITLHNPKIPPMEQSNLTPHKIQPKHLHLRLSLRLLLLTLKNHISRQRPQHQHSLHPLRGQ